MLDSPLPVAAEAREERVEDGAHNWWEGLRIYGEEGLRYQHGMQSAWRPLLEGQTKLGRKKPSHEPNQTQSLKYPRKKLKVKLLCQTKKEFARGSAPESHRATSPLPGYL